MNVGSPKIYGVLLQKLCQRFCHIHPILLIEHYQTPKVSLVIYSLRMW
jgi:predicted membrane chloride channel (bestrophin family)